MLEASEALQKMEEMKKIELTLFHQYKEIPGSSATIPGSSATILQHSMNYGKRPQRSLIAQPSTQ